MLLLSHSHNYVPKEASRNDSITCSSFHKPEFNYETVKGSEFSMSGQVLSFGSNCLRLCSSWVRHGSTTISYPQCSLIFMREPCLHRSFAYAKSAVGIDVMSVHKLFAYRVVSTVSIDIVSSHTKYCRIESHRYHKIAECIARYK